MHVRGTMLLATAVVSLWATAEAAAQGKSKTQPVSFRIEDNLAVRGDNINGNVYTDYRGAPPSCVEVTVDQVFIRFNRHHPDSSTNPFVYCENAVGYEAPKRQYWIRTTSQPVCNEFLQRNQAGQVVPDGDTGACLFNGSDKPRIRAADAFKARSNTRIDVTFLILDYTNTFAYEVQGTALVTGDSVKRVLSNVGTSHRPVRVIRNETADLPGIVVEPVMDLPFQFTLTKVPVAP